MSGLTLGMMALLLATSSLPAATREYQDYDATLHAALPFDRVAARVPPVGFAVDPATRRVSNPEDLSDETWRARAGLARARYVRRGDLLLAELPAGSGSAMVEYRVYHLGRLDEVPEPLDAAEFAARRLVFLAPYDMESRQYRIEVFLGDSEREWFPLPRTSSDPARRAALRRLLGEAEARAKAPTWDQTQELLDRLQAEPGLLHGLYLESFGRHPPKPEPRRR
jgi:hypothetical protein